MPQELVGELPERAGPSSATAVAIKSRDDSPARLGASRRRAREYSDWSWRTQRGKGVLRMNEFNFWRKQLAALAGGDLFRQLKPMRPSTWLPDDAPPLHLRKYSARDGQLIVAMSHDDLARVERHVVDRGLATPAQVAQAWRAFAATGRGLVAGRHGTLVVATDESYTELMDERTRQNAPIIAAKVQAQAIAEASSTPSSSELPKHTALEPPSLAPSSPSSPVVVVAPPDAPAAPSPVSSSALSDAVEPVELADPLEDLDAALREADEVVAPSASRPSFKKDWVVHWGQLVEGCESCTKKHLRREKARPGSTPKGILAMLPLTPAKLFASTLALDFEDSTFKHLARDGTRSILLRHKVFRDALCDLLRRCGLDGVTDHPQLRFPVVLRPDIHDFLGAERLAASSVADLDRAWSAAGRPVPAQRSPASDKPPERVKAPVPINVINWADIVEACRACNEAHDHAHKFKKSNPAVPGLVAMLPLTPVKLFESAAPDMIRECTYKHSPFGVVVGYKFAVRALVDLARRCGLDASDLDRLRIFLPMRSSATRLEGPELLGADSIEDVERAWEAAGRPGRCESPAVDRAPKAPDSKKRPTEVVAAPSPSATPDSSVSTTPALSSVESTPEPPSKRARTTAAAVPRTAPAPPVVVVVEDERAQRDALDTAKELGAKHFELETLRLAHAHALKHGAAAFVSVDIEMWERNTSDLLEFGWSTLELVKDRKTGEVKTRRDTQHAVVKENAHRRNGRWSPDNRDNFAFGRTVRLPQQAIYHTLAALLHTLSAHAHVFLIFHDPRADLRALDGIGFNTAREFEPDLRRLGSPTSGKVYNDGGKVWIVDTQRLFSAWINRKVQTGLEKACAEVQVPTKPALLHNAANDAYYTLNLFERLMDRQRTPSPTSTLVKHLDERARVEAERKRGVTAVKAKRAEERREQTALSR